MFLKTLSNLKFNLLKNIFPQDINNKISMKRKDLRPMSQSL